MKWKLYKESISGKVKLTIGLKVDAVEGDSVDDALQKLQVELKKVEEEIRNAGSTIETRTPHLVKKYDFWNKENDGDVWFNIYESPYVTVDLENEGI